MTSATLSGWGHYPLAECRQQTLRTTADMRTLTAAEPALIARGMGRSYGDAALNPHCTLEMRRMDRMLAFDAGTGRLTCEGGVLLSDILDIFMSRGWFPPVTPGTKFVTVGGMLASDVHGKNHHVAGSFGDYVESFDLSVADGGTVTCTPQQNADLFAATRGGMGLTGIILRLTFRLMRIETAFIRQETLRARNLAEIMALFESSSHWSYSVAWIDCLARGEATGRSLLYRGEHATLAECPPHARANPLVSTPRKKLTVPPFFPSFTVNRWSVRAFNELYYRRAREGEAVIGYDGFFYPLDALNSWHHLYGRRGFVQYQCVLPKAASEAGIRRLLSAISEAGDGSFLAVLKLFGKQNGLMSFPMEGYTLALDFPARPASFALLDKLDAIVGEYGGRVYLAKDARTKAQSIAKAYPGLAEFQAIRRKWKADQKFSSLLSERLAL